MLFESALSYVIDIFKDETVKAVIDRRTKESNLVCFIGPICICLPSNYGKSLNYQVAPAKTGLISRGEHHSLSWQFLHMHLRFPAQIETSASWEGYIISLGFCNYE
jgi:hypothetical protein